MNRDRFATTSWSMVLAAAQRGSDDSAAALEQLCTRYWSPVFAFVRRRGYSPEDAQDLTQGFFTRLIEKNELGNADRERGRFRTFLLTACQHYLLNERERTSALKRGGGHTPLSIDAAAAESRYQRALAHEQTPERVYDRLWCLALLDSALDTLRGEYAASGNEALFEFLKSFLTAPDDAGTYADAAQELGMTQGAVRTAVHRLRQRYRNALRQRIGETVVSSSDIDAEMRYLIQAM